MCCWIREDVRLLRCWSTLCTHVCTEEPSLVGRTLRAKNNISCYQNFSLSDHELQRALVYLINCASYNVSDIPGVGINQVLDKPGVGTIRLDCTPLSDGNSRQRVRYE